MEKEKELSEYLQHVRLIHLSLLVVSATITYLVLSTWSTSNELVIDLKEFTQMMEKAAQSHEDPKKLAQILPDWEKIGVEPIKSSLEKQLGRKITFGGPEHIIIRETEPGPLPSEFESLAKSRSELERRKWNIEVPESFQSDLSAVRDLIQGMGRDPVIRMVVKSWPSETKPGYADIPGYANIEAIFTWVETETLRDINGNVQIKHTQKSFTRTFENKEWKSRTAIVSFTPESLAKRFHYMEEYWDSIKLLPYQRAVNWANDQRIEELKSRNPSLFGIEIRGEHIGYVGPVLTGCLLMYLLSYLTQLDGLSKRGQLEVPSAAGTLSPWIGTMTNLSAVIITWLTLTIGPFMAVGLPLWRLLGLHWFWSVVLGLCAGLIGFRCAWISGKLAFNKS